LDAPGGRPAAFVAASFCDSEAAIRELSARWGYPAAPADIKVNARHHDFGASVTINRHSLLELALRKRRPLPSLNLQPLPSMNLARNREDGRLVLVQVDVEAAFAQSDGGSERSVRVSPKCLPRCRESEVDKSDECCFRYRRPFLFTYSTHL
jgi:hypothetical protein